MLQDMIAQHRIVHYHSCPSSMVAPVYVLTTSVTKKHVAMKNSQYSECFSNCFFLLLTMSLTDQLPAKKCIISILIRLYNKKHVYAMYQMVPMSYCQLDAKGSNWLLF